MKVSRLGCVVPSWICNKPRSHDIGGANFPLSFQSINTLLEVVMATSKVSMFFRLSGK